MKCEETRDQITDYVSGNLDPESHSRIEQHLFECVACRDELGSLKTLWAKLGVIPSVEPGSDLKARVDGMLRAYKQGLDHVPSISLSQGMNNWLAGWWPRQPALQLGLAIGLLFIGVIVGNQFRPFVSVQSNNEIADLRAEIHQLRETIALSFMQHESASDRLQGVNWSNQLRMPGEDVLTALLDTLMHDSNVNVRLATVDALRQFGDQPVVRRGVIEAIARQESPMVQIALIDLVVDLREKESAGTLRQLSLDSTINAAVRERAGTGLARLE